MKFFQHHRQKYDAEGKSGLINIILKKTQAGISKITLRSSYIQTTYPAYVLGLNYIRNKNKTNFMIDIISKKGSELADQKSEIFFPTQKWDGRTLRKDQEDFLNSRIDLDYNISDKISIGFQYMLGLNYPDENDNTQTSIFNNQTATIDSIIMSRGDNKVKNYNHSLNFHTLIKLDSIGKSISMDLDFFKYDVSQNRNFKSQTYLPNFEPIGLETNVNTKNGQDIRIYSAKIDVTHPLNWADLYFGSKVSNITNSNFVKYIDISSDNPILDIFKSNDFTYKENTFAVYVNANKKINEKWETNIGIRFENTKTEGNLITTNKVNKKEYLNFFPTAYINYKYNGSNNFNLSYGRRIERPAYYEQNPFRWYFNNYLYSEGNPFLEASISDNFEVSHTFENNLTTTLSFSNVSNGFGQVNIIDPINNQQKFTRLNYFSQSTIGISEAYTFKKIKWLISYNQLYLYLNNYNFNDSTLIKDKQFLSFYFFSSNNLVFNNSKTILGTLNLTYISPSVYQQYNSSKICYVDIGLKFLFLKNNLQLSINATDIFKTKIPNYTSDLNDIKRNFSSYYDYRKVNISLTYRLGNSKIKSLKDRKKSNEEERVRAKINH